MRNGDYGYDAPYALLAFTALGAVSVAAAIVSRWRQNSHMARRRLGWRFWYGNPFAGTSLVTAWKSDRT